MYNKVLSGILAVLLIAITCVLGYFGYNYYKKIKLNKDAAEYLEEFDTLVVKLNKEIEEEELNNPDDQNQGNGSNQMRGIETDKLVYKGFKVVGKLEMPTINIQYPILDVITHAKAIEVSVGILYGPGVNQPGNTVIIGHNYNNGLFFGKNKHLQVGQKIYTRVRYFLYNKENRW